MTFALIVQRLGWLIVDQQTGVRFPVGALGNATRDHSSAVNPRVIGSSPISPAGTDSFGSKPKAHSLRRWAERRVAQLVEQGKNVGLAFFRCLFPT